ncbi:MAG: DUF5453 family protein [Mycoplasmoidaceae bacterium]
MALFRETTDLDKKPTWYLFLAANVIVLLGCAITWILFKQQPVQYNLTLIPTLVCNIVALILCGIFIYLEAKGIMAKAAHFRKKWLHWYLAAMIVFVVAILFCFIFIFIFNGYHPSIKDDHNRVQMFLVIYFVITGVLTLVSVGLQRYARFKIDLDIYRRLHGEMPKKEEEIKERSKAPSDSSAQPTSGLTDEINNQ